MKRTMLFSLLLVLLLTMLWFPSAARAAQPVPLSLEQVDGYVAAKMKELGIPGLALGVVQGDRVVHLRGYGVAGPDGRTMTPQTPFIIGSVSKGVTALAVMQLVERGRVALEAPVQQYLPWFPAPDITIRHLLHQNSGITTHAGRSLMADNYPGSDAIQIHARKMSAEPRQGRPGANYAYSNANYVILGAVIEAVSGQTYPDYVHEHIFTPLAMENSFSAQRAAVSKGMSAGYRQWLHAPIPFEAPYPAGSVPAGYLISSAEDMAHYLVAQLNGGVYAGKQILTAESIATLHQGGAAISDHEMYGMGWIIGEREGLPAVYHSGNVPNFQSYAILLPEQSAGLVMLVNVQSTLNGQQIFHLAWDVAHILVGEEPVAVKPGPVIYAVIGVIGASVLGTILLLAWAFQRYRQGAGCLRIAIPVFLLLGIAGFNLIGLPRLVDTPIPAMLLFSPDLSWPTVISGGIALVGAVGFPALRLFNVRSWQSEPT